MAVLGRGIKILCLVAADGMEEATPRTPRCHLYVELGERFWFPAVLGVELPVLDPALGRVILVEHFELEGEVLLLGFIHETTHLEDQEHITELHDGHLHIRCLALVALGETASKAPDFGWQL